MATSDVIDNALTVSENQIAAVLARVGAGYEYLGLAIDGQPIFGLVGPTAAARKEMRDAGYAYGTWRRQGSRPSIRGWH